jgi:hypothetical protein
MLHRGDKDVERGMEGTVIAEGRGKKDGKERKKERKFIYLHLAKQWFIVITASTYSLAFDENVL